MADVAADLAERGVRAPDGRGRRPVHTQFLIEDLADELQLVVAPFFVGESRAPRFVERRPLPVDRRASRANSPRPADRRRRAAALRALGPFDAAGSTPSPARGRAFTRSVMRGRGRWVRRDLRGSRRADAGRRRLRDPRDPAAGAGRARGRLPVGADRASRWSRSRCCCSRLVRSPPVRRVIAGVFGAVVVVAIVVAALDFAFEWTVERTVQPRSTTGRE